MSADLFEAFGSPANHEHEAITPLRSGGQQSRSADKVVPNASAARPGLHTVKDEHFWETSSNGNEVLFDALAEEDQEDDFGDFEDVHDGHVHSTTTGRVVSPAREPGHKSEPTTDLSLIDLGLDEQSIGEGGQSRSAMVLGSFDHSIERDHKTQPETPDDTWGDFEEVPGTSTQQGPPTRTTPAEEDEWQSFEALDGFETKAGPIPPTPPEDDWDTFEDGEEPPAPSPQNTFPTQHSIAPGSKPQTSNPPPLRPTTVPPPSLLLSLFHSLIEGSLRPMRRSVSAHEQPTVILMLHHTLLRILSGRLHRWRRDLHLSQSTRISAAGKPGGMKLTSLSKDEKTKEEREAAEAVEIWNRNLHSATRILSDGHLPPKAGGLRIVGSPLLREVKGPGVLEDRLCCAVCGLKRSERVAGLDEGEDVFGEFWIDSWGHVECERWWAAAEFALRQR